MGVHGLTTFIDQNPGLMVDYQARNTHLVIDTFNIMNRLAQGCQKGTRADLFGGDLVSYGRHIHRFFDNLEKCNIVPILVMDGAQTYEVNKSKVREKLSRSKERFRTVMSINQHGFGSFVYPVPSNSTFKSIAVDRGIKIHQSIYEADTEVVRLARQYKCPALSGDSDFFLFDLPHGLIRVDDFNFENLRDCKSEAENWRQPPKSSKPQFFIPCRLFKQERFKDYLPGLDIKCLPLLGPLLGNDFVSTGSYEGICSRLPSNLALEFPNPYMARYLKPLSAQHEKIIKILCFCCDKEPFQVVNQLSLSLPKEKRAEFKSAIKAAMAIYSEPAVEDIESEIRKIYEAGFRTTFSKRYPDTAELEAQFDKTIKSLVNWLVRCSERSVMTHKLIELMNKNTIFVRLNMDDPSLLCAHNCQNRVYGVLLRLLRSSPAAQKPIEVYTRIGLAYEKFLLKQVHKLDEFGPINYLVYDVPDLPLDKRRDLVLATFHSNRDRFMSGLIECDLWFEPKLVEEFMSVIMILDYIDRESQDAKLWKRFRQATLLCLVYYFCIKQRDANFSDQMERLNDLDFLPSLGESIRRLSLTKMPILSDTRRGRRYKCRTMHQITQLQVSIVAFNLLNSFLGDPYSRIRVEYWLNSCLLYNLTEYLKKKWISPRLPAIITEEAFIHSGRRMKLPMAAPLKASCRL